VVAFAGDADGAWYATKRTLVRWQRSTHKWSILREVPRGTEITGLLTRGDEIWLAVSAEWEEPPKQAGARSGGLFRFDKRSEVWQSLWQEAGLRIMGPVLCGREVWAAGQPISGPQGIRLRSFVGSALNRNLVLESGLVGRERLGGYLFHGLAGGGSRPWVFWERRDEYFNDMWGVAGVDPQRHEFSPSVATYLESMFFVVPSFIKDISYIPLESNLGWALPADDSVWFGWGRFENWPYLPGRPTAVMRYQATTGKWTMLVGPSGPACAPPHSDEVWVLGDGRAYRVRRADGTCRSCPLPFKGGALIAAGGGRIWLAEVSTGRVWYSGIGE
jgi:hypothetical protein